MELGLGKYWFIMLLMVLVLLTTGCSKNDMPFPRCISADYFGPEPIAVSAHFSSEHDSFIPEDGEVIDSVTGEINFGFHSNQVIKWKDTGLQTNGENLVVRVNGAWTSCSNKNKKEFKGSYSLQGLEQLKYEAKFESKKEDNGFPNFYSVCNDYKSSAPQKISSSPHASCTTNCKYIGKNNSSGENLSHCWFTNGYGAYLLFRRPNDPSPNESLNSMRNPKSPTIHLGYDLIGEGESGLFTLKRNSTKLKDKNCNTLNLEKGWRIYVKILDRYYLDNAGGYSFEFLSGVQNLSTFEFFDYIYNYLKCTLLINENCKKHFDSADPAAAQSIFQNIAEKSTSFHSFVLSLLVLFIAISALLYLFGMIRETKHDMLIRMMKITLVIVLISPESFKFFYNHFLVLFIKSLEHLISIITNFTPNSRDNLNFTGEAKLFDFIEDMFNKFYAYSVWKKLSALLHYQTWTSLLMIPAIFIGTVLYFLLCVYAYIIFLSGFVGIAFLIAIMPLFLVSILFSQLKNLLEGWIRFCTSFCVQSIMMFTLLSLLASIIMNTFYKQLGFTVCYNKWLKIRLCAPKWVFGGFCLIDREYFAWTPGQIFVPYTIGEVSTPYIDNKSIEVIDELSRAGGTIKFTGGARYIYIPPDYLQKGFRYVDYPFFNPLSNTENAADHYIDERDIVVATECSQNEKDLVRLTNSLLHASEKSDILLLISSIEAKMGTNINSEIIKYNCQSKLDIADKCVNFYQRIINDYRKGIIQPDLKSEIKFLVQKIIMQSRSCQLKSFFDQNHRYQVNSDYQRVKDIQRGHLINIGEIFILFLLSFLMFSLKEFVQQLGSSIASGGFSVYTISSMYHTSPIAGVPGELKQQWQDFVGGKLESLGSWISHLPGRLSQDTAGILGKVPRVGGILEHTISVPRKLIGTSIEATKFITSPKNDIDKLEEKIYIAFGLDKEDIMHRRISKYLEYYKGYIGSHLGYSIENAMKFTLKYGPYSVGINPVTGKKDLYQHSLLYKVKIHRREFLERLHDYTIGRTRETQKRLLKKEDNKHKQLGEVARKLGTERDLGDNDALEVTEKRAERARKKRRKDQEGERSYNNPLFTEGQNLEDSKKTDGVCDNE